MDDPVCTPSRILCENNVNQNITTDTNMYLYLHSFRFFSGDDLYPPGLHTN